MLTGRQKITAALSPAGSPEFGVVICYEDIYIRDHWRQLTDLPWWYSRSPDLVHQMAWRKDVVPNIRQDWLTLPECPPVYFRQNHVIEERPGGIYRVNRLTRSAVLLSEPTVGGWDSFDRGYSGHVDRMALSFSEIDQQIEPAPVFDRLSFQAEGRGDLAAQVLAELGAQLYPIGYVGSPLWQCFYLWGFEGLMTMIAQEPELVHYACQRFLGKNLVTIQEAAALGAAGIWVEECLTDMISPHAYASLSLPYVRQLIEAIRSAGMQSLYYFCGNPTDRLELLLAAGSDALALEESKKGFQIDIAQVAEVVAGRCALLGNLDAIHLLPQATEDDLRAEICRQIDAGRKNHRRFVMSLGSPVTPGTTPARLRLYCDLVHELTRAAS